MLRQVKKKEDARVLRATIRVATSLLVLTLSVSASALRKSTQVAPGIVATDPAIQKIAETALHAAIDRHKAGLGFVVVSDPATGRILAVANEDRSETVAARTPHWALSLRLGPASLTKTLIAAMAVEKGKTRYDAVHDCAKGNYVVGGKEFHDWKAFDKLSTADTVIHSSNICGIKIGETLGAKGVQSALAQFGFGEGGTAEGFPESRSGDIGQPKSAKDDLYTATIASGYGDVYVSPIEVVQAFGAIANGGTLLKAKSSSSPVEPEAIRRVLSTQTAEATSKVLADVLVRGTALGAGSKAYALAGKTATAYSRTHVDHDSLGGDSNIAAFAGFGPVKDPKIVVFVVIENPTDQKGVHGSVHAAPLFAEVAEKTLQHLKVAESR